MSNDSKKVKRKQRLQKPIAITKSKLINIKLKMLAGNPMIRTVNTTFKLRPKSVNGIFHVYLLCFLYLMKVYPKNYLLSRDNYLCLLLGHYWPKLYYSLRDENNNLLEEPYQRCFRCGLNRIIPIEERNKMVYLSKYGWKFKGDKITFIDKLRYFFRKYFNSQLI